MNMNRNGVIFVLAYYYVNTQGVNYHLKDTTQTQQQRPESSTIITVTWHVSKYKVHKLVELYSLDIKHVIVCSIRSCGHAE